MQANVVLGEYSSGFLQWISIPDVREKLDLSGFPLSLKHTSVFCFSFTSTSVFSLIFMHTSGVSLSFMRTSGVSISFMHASGFPLNFMHTSLSTGPAATKEPHCRRIYSGLFW